MHHSSCSVDHFNLIFLVDRFVYLFMWIEVVSDGKEGLSISIVSIMLIYYNQTHVSKSTWIILET